MVAFEKTTVIAGKSKPNLKKIIFDGIFHLQVRDLSKDIAEEVRKRARENQMKKSSELKAQKERIFQECKKMKCEELERKYYEAMEKMGLAHDVANAEVIQSN